MSCNSCKVPVPTTKPHNAATQVPKVPFNISLSTPVAQYAQNAANTQLILNEPFVVSTVKTPTYICKSECCSLWTCPIFTSLQTYFRTNNTYTAAVPFIFSPTNLHRLRAIVFGPYTCAGYDTWEFIQTLIRYYDENLVALAACDPARFAECINALFVQQMRMNQIASNREHGLFMRYFILKDRQRVFEYPSFCDAKRTNRDDLAGIVLQNECGNAHKTKCDETNIGAQYTLTTPDNRFLCDYRARVI